MRWTKDDIARAFEMRANGWSYTQIGKKLGGTRNAVAGYFHRNSDRGFGTLRRADPKQWPHSKDGDKLSLAVMAMREPSDGSAPVSWRRIAKALGRCENQCRDHYGDIVRELNESEGA